MGFWALVVLAALAVAFVDRGDAMANAPANLDAIYKSVAEVYGEDWRLLKAFARKESSENPLAVNPGDPSYGLFAIQSHWLVYFKQLDLKDSDREAKAREMLSDPTFATDMCCRILRYFRNRTNPSTLAGFRFPEEADIYNVGETLWAKGVRNAAYRDFIVSEYRKLSAV
jgi:hypothetical protein